MNVTGTVFVGFGDFDFDFFDGRRAGTLRAAGAGRRVRRQLTVVTRRVTATPHSVD